MRVVAEELVVASTIVAAFAVAVAFAARGVVAFLGHVVSAMLFAASKAVVAELEALKTEQQEP